ncbi:MAG TPA: hypothetical protein VEH03_04830 [Burkholderiales bacterium]|nr:hypothetical protein [Burkholderiales bacterium]
MSILEWIFVAWLCIMPLYLLASRSGKGRGEALLDQAISLEEACNYEEACFRYAIAARSGYLELCRIKVRDLWKEHGPFDFSAQLKTLRADYCRCCTSCGEGFYHLVVSDIHEWIGE